MKSLYIRHVPDEVHQVLTERAAKAGVSLSAYALQLLQHSAQQPTEEDVFERFRQRPLS